MQDFLRRAGADGPFDAYRGGLPEADLDPVLGGQGGLYHLLLDLAVQGDVDLLADVVLADVDERVLLGDLGYRDMKPRLVTRIAGHDRGLQRRRRELMLAGVAAARPDRSCPDHVADLDFGQTRQPGDLARAYLIAACRGAVGEDADRRYLAFAAVAEPHPIPGRDRAREHADISDLVAREPALDLENAAAYRPACVLSRRGQHPGELVQQEIDARAGDGGPEVDRVHHGLLDLAGQLLPQPVPR